MSMALDAVAVVALLVALAALTVALFLWLRLRKVYREITLSQTAKEPHGPRNTLPSMELTLEAMLEELEQRGQGILNKIERREQEFNDTLTDVRREMRHFRDQGRVGDGSASPRGEESAEQLAKERRPDSQKAALVLRMAEDGEDVLSIAKRLGLGKGEVQLILDLRHRTS